jgi:integrase
MAIKTPKVKGASVTKRGDSYRVYVSHGYDSAGKKIAETATWKPDRQRTDRQNTIALQDFTLDFMRDVKSNKRRTAENMTYSDLIDKWRTLHGEKKLEDTTLERTEYAFALIEPALGHIKLVELTALDIEEFYDTLQKTGYVQNGIPKEYADATIKRTHNAITTTLNFAFKKGLIDENPCARVTPPKVDMDPNEIVSFTDVQAKAFLKFLDLDYIVVKRGRKKKNGEPSKEHTELHTVPLQVKALFTMACYGGFRRGEMIALLWSDINFVAGTVSVTKNTIRTKKGVFTKPPKTKSSIRTVKLPPVVMDMLERLKREQRELRVSLGSAWRGSAGPAAAWQASQHLFTQADGAQMCLTSPNVILKKTIDRFNETTQGDKLPEITLHGLRHSCASMLISNGLDPRAAAGVLGHSEATTTLNIYSHLMPDAQEKAAAIMDNVLTEKVS